LADRGAAGLIDRITMAALAASGLFVPAVAHAAPEEIQVYMDEINRPGEIGLDVHVNHVLVGDGTPDYPGGESSLHRLRVTPEFSLGLTNTLELGAYLPLATLARDGVVRVDGFKFRLKYLAPHKETGFYWGANLELGKVSHPLDINPYNGELKLIGGWRNGRWIVGFNGNIDFVVSGPQHDPVTFELATKLGYKVSPALTLGLESYNGAGALRALGHFGSSEQTTFIAADTYVDSHWGRFDINAGLGKGYGSNTDSTILKFTIGVPIGRK
jgi:hypothetical protein